MGREYRKKGVVGPFRGGAHALAETRTLRGRRQGLSSTAQALAAARRPTKLRHRIVPLASGERR
eukprot:9492049-Pyramimonas_sp.AAC.2